MHRLWSNPTNRYIAQLSAELILKISDLYDNLAGKIHCNEKADIFHSLFISRSDMKKTLAEKEFDKSWIGLHNKIETWYKISTLLCS